jgi:small subunit ribosomal protein S9
MADQSFYATGKRKTAVARVWIKPGSGNITVNRQPLEDYFGGGNDFRKRVEKPFVLTATGAKFDVLATLQGGGKCAQSEALRHGITKALLTVDPEYRSALKKAGLVTRDPRIKERKKYGQKGARARFQFSKR